MVAGESGATRLSCSSFLCCVLCLGASKAWLFGGLIPNDFYCFNGYRA